MFNIQMLPADHGDCLWIEYGDEADARRILIDGGTEHSFDFLVERINEFPAETLDFELFVITHVDSDHIGGSLELLRRLDKLDKKIVFGDVWFNGWKHLSDQLGDKQGEFVTHHLETRKLLWNKAFEKSTKAVVVPDAGILPVHVLPGGMKLTLLSPNRAKLNKLRDRWLETIIEAGLVPGQVKDEKKVKVKPADRMGDTVPDIDSLADAKFKSDKTPANGSSIAFLAEYADGGKTKNCLFTGDAHMDVLTASIKRLMTEDKRRVKNGRLKLDTLKISHHGSQKNLSKDLLDLVDCDKFLFSTNGQQFSHPDPESVARVIKYGRPANGADPVIFFNYKTEFNEFWDDRGLQFNHNYETEFPSAERNGIVIKL